MKCASLHCIEESTIFSVQPELTIFKCDKCHGEAVEWLKSVGQEYVWHPISKTETEINTKTGLLDLAAKLVGKYIALRLDMRDRDEEIVRLNKENLAITLELDGLEEQVAMLEADNEVLNRNIGILMEGAPTFTFSAN